MVRNVIRDVYNFGWIPINLTFSKIYINAISSCINLYLLFSTLRFGIVFSVQSIWFSICCNLSTIISINNIYIYMGIISVMVCNWLHLRDNDVHLRLRCDERCILTEIICHGFNCRQKTQIAPQILNDDKWSMLVLV